MNSHPLNMHPLKKPLDESGLEHGQEEGPQGAERPAAQPKAPDRHQVLAQRVMTEVLDI